jgi:hypothetical protein
MPGRLRDRPAHDRAAAHVPGNFATSDIFNCGSISLGQLTRAKLDSRCTAKWKAPEHHSGAFGKPAWAFWGDGGPGENQAS